MLYQINHPDAPRKWSRVDVSDFDSLLERFGIRERMVRDSIELLKFHDVENVLNLGGFSFQVERTEDVAPIIRSLEDLLKIALTKN